MPNDSNDIVDAHARLESAALTVMDMEIAESHDPSITNALWVATDSLVWFGRFRVPGPDKYVTWLLALADARIRAQFLDLTVNLQAVVEEFTRADEQYLAEETGVLLREVVRFFAEVTRLVPGDEDFRQALESKYVTCRTTLSSFQLWRRAQGAVEKAEEAADSAAESAGTTAEHSLSEEFVNLAKKETDAADKFRGATVFLFATVIIYTAVVAYVESAKPAIEIGQKLGLTVPVLLLAGYFAREANQHRRTGRWASVLEAQLKSIRAYSIELNPSQRDELKLLFGKRVFLESPETAATSQDPTPVTAGQDVASVLREAADLARAARGTP